jgi:small subunit ribosomal protein S2
MLTNYQTIKKSIRKLDIIEKMEDEGQIDLMTKKEALMLTRKKQKLMNYLGGIRDMKTAPDLIFIVDTVKEKIAVQEANCLNIPVIAPIDTNCDPDVITYPIPGNDDAIRSVQLFCKEMAEAINAGKELRAQEEGADEEVSTEGESKPAVGADISDAEKEKLIAESVKEGEAEVETTSDDLTKLSGVGPAGAAKLIEAGITTFAQVAAMDEAKIAELKLKSNFSDAIEDAKKLTA